MAPKAAKAEEGLTAEQQDAQRASDRLKRLAVDKGVVANRQTFTTQQLPLSKALVKSNGKDIVKKSSLRKNRYMLVFNCLLAPAAAGRMGVLAAMDTMNPVLYLEFPKGRLKLFGTLTFPHNKYMVLRMGGAGPVLCEDVFEMMIVFSEAWWVGTKEENPKEVKLPMPPELSDVQHTSYDFAYGAAAAPTAEAAAGKSSQAAADEADDVDMDQAEAAVGSQRPRRAAVKRRYTDDGMPADEEDESSDDGGEQRQVGARAIAAVKVPVVTLPRAAGAAGELPSVTTAGAGPSKRQPQSAAHKASKQESEEDVIEVSSDDEPLARAVGSKAQRATPRRQAGTAARKRMQDWSDDDDDGDDEEDDAGYSEGGTASQDGSD